MSEQSNPVAELALERAVNLQARLANQAPQPAEAGQAARQPESAPQAAQAAAELKQLLQTFEQQASADDESMARMLALAETPGILDLLEDVDPEIITLLRTASGGSEPAASAEKKPTKVKPADVTPSARSAPRPAEAQPIVPASAEPGNVEESPLREMTLKEFKQTISRALEADELNDSVFKDRGLNRLVEVSLPIEIAWESRDDLGEVQRMLVDAIENLLNIRIMKKRMTAEEVATIKAENRVIAERIVNRVIGSEAEEETEEEVAERPKRGLGSLLRSIVSSPGRGIRRAINGLENYYSHSVDAVAGRSAEVEQEVEYSPEEMSKLEEFLKIVRNTQKRSRITKQLRKIRDKNEVLQLAENDAENHDEEIKARQDVLNKITEATNLIAGINSYEPNLMDEDPSLQDPGDIVRLLEILNELNVSIDGARKDPKKVADFMPAREEGATVVEDEEEAETDEEAGEKKVGFWERVQFWNKGKKEADAFVAGADFAYISTQLKNRLRQLDPKDRYFKNKHSALVRTQGLLASVEAAEDYKDRTKGVQRDHKAINQLRKELASLGILASKDAAEKVRQDAEAENKAAEAVDNAELSQGKKNWLKKKLKETGDFLRNPAFLLGVATGATTDIVLHLMGADPGNKAWIKVALAGLIGETALTQYSRGKLSTLGQKGGAVGMASRGLFWMQDLAVQAGGRSMSHFMLGFSGGAIGMHLGHTAFDNLSHNGPTIDHSSVATDSGEQPSASKDAHEVSPGAHAETGAVASAAHSEPGVAAAVASEAAQEIKGGAQKWQETLSKWWGGLLAATQEQTAKKQEAQVAAATAAPSEGASESKNPFFTELDQQRAGVDTTANVHDGSSAPRSGVDAHAAAATTPASGVDTHEVAHATVVAATPVVEQQPPAVEVVKFDSQHIWAEAAQITGGDNNRTDFLKDVGVMFDHAGAGNHEHKMGDSVIVITDSVHTAADLQKLHDLHPEAAGFTLPDESLKKLDAFYQEALNTEPAQRNALQQDVIQHFTGGMSGADLADNPRAVEAMLKIAHGETVDGSQHIIGTATEQVGSAVESGSQPTQQTAKEILDAAVQEHNLELKHPLVGQGVIDHLMHEVPDNKIEHPELIATFVDGIWDKWVEGCHKLNLDPMQASPKIVDYIKNPSYDGTDPLSVSPVRATMIDYIQHGNSMHGFTMERGDGQTINLNLYMAHSVLTKVDDNPSIGQLMANNGVDSAIGQINIEEVFGNNADAYYRQVQNKQTP